MSRERAIAVFLTTTAFGALPALLAVLEQGKLELHAAINAHHDPLADLFFRYATHLGDGIVPTILALFLLWWKDWRALLMVGASAAFSAIIAQLLKHFLFPEVDRPSMFFDRMPGINVVPGLDLYHHFSFPSGHSTSAFSTCLALVVLSGRQAHGFALALIACVIGFSRVYLSQHFTEDVLGGALIGSVTAVAVWWWLYRSAFSTKQWLGRSPFRSRV